MLERFLADLELIRTDPGSLPRTARAVALSDRESSASRHIDLAMTMPVFRLFGLIRLSGLISALVTARRPRVGSPDVTWFVHVYRDTAPGRGERSAYSFPIERLGAHRPEVGSVATVLGDLEPGAGVAVVVDGTLIEPTGPLRPLVCGVRWPG